MIAPVALLLFYPTWWAPLFFSPVLVIWGARRVAEGRFTRQTPLDGAFVIMLLMAIVGLYVSVDLELSWTRFWHILLGTALFYTLVNWLRTMKRCRLLGDLVIFGSCVVALLALVGADWSKVRFLNLDFYHALPALLHNPSWGGYIPSRGRAFNPRAISMGLATLFPVVLSLAISGEGRWHRRLAGLVALLLGGLLVLMQSLQAMIGVSLALLVLLVWRDRRFLWLVPVSAALGVAALLAYGPHRITITALSIENVLGIGVVLRLDMWNRALAMLRAMPFTGIGLDTYMRLQTQFYPGLLLGPEGYSHNLFLQLALDLGLPGLIAVLWLPLGAGVVAIKAARKHAPTEARALLQGSCAGIAAYFGAGLIDVPWGTKSGLAFWVLLGMTIATAQLLDEGAVDISPGRRWGLLVGLVALTALALLLFPSRADLNRALIPAHKDVMQAQAGPPQSLETLAHTATRLEAALARYPTGGDGYRTLGRLYGWLGQHGRAIEALDRGVRLDGKNPMARYAPWVVWLRQIQGHSESDRWKDLIWVYSYWMSRYPKRAESYIQIALVWEQHGHDPVRARAVLGSGLANGAEPEGLLTYYLSRIE